MSQLIITVQNKGTHNFDLFYSNIHSHVLFYHNLNSTYVNYIYLHYQNNILKIGHVELERHT